jgi:stage II sporulation protein AB (anti-sigma F factor)
MEASNTQNNEMEIRFDSRSENEGFARVSVASFLTQLNPTVEEVADVKTAVSEAVTNAIIHGYEQRVEKVKIHCSIENQLFTVDPTPMEIQMRLYENDIQTTLVENAARQKKELEVGK